jgi:hypothetical protein
MKLLADDPALLVIGISALAAVLAMIALAVRLLRSGQHGGHF